MSKALSNIDYLALRHPEDSKTIDRLNLLKFPTISFTDFVRDFSFSTERSYMEQLKEWKDLLVDAVKVHSFQDFLAATTGKYREAYNEVENFGEGINVTSESLPAMYQQLLDACTTLGIKDIPAYSTDWYFGPFHYSNGEKKRRIVMMSGCSDLFTDEEMMFTLGHELGHMACQHKPYHMLVECMYLPFIDEGVFKIWASLIKLPLLEWYRTSDYTADRVGLLCCQDIDVALRTMIKKAGLPQKCYEKIDIESFKQQAIHFEEDFTGISDTIVKALSIRSSEYPWLVVRAGKLLEWYNSGEYQRLIDSHS